MVRWTITITIAAILLITVMTILFVQSWLKGPEMRLEDVNVVMFKDPFCGCCEEYARYIRGLGARVDVSIVPTIESKLREFQVPESLWSCHIMMVGEYIVVGHVPVEAIEKLLREKPPVKGISLPGMPLGSPGMPGQKQGSFIVYSFSEKGEVAVYMII